MAIYTPCVCRLIVWKCTRKILSMGCNLNKIYLKICFHCTSSNKTSKITKICHSPKTSLGRCLSVLVKFYSICGYKILTAFFFKGVNKFKKIVEEKRLKAYSGPRQTSRMNYFCKNKNNLNKVS